MTTVEELTLLRDAAFRSARAVIEDWRSTSRRTTTAGVTSALRHSGVIDLEALGLTSNREFWDLAEASGLLSVAQQPNGHRLVLLPGEELAHFTFGSETPTTQTDTSLVRLKSDVWTSFVDWNPAYRRFWDRDHSRAFMIPTADGWGPTDIDTTRFVEIEPALQSHQIGWMRDFSRTQPEPARSALESSIGEHAPRGAFRREIRERGLHRAWRAALQAQILDVAATWAHGAGVDMSSIIETRSRAAEHAPPNRSAVTRPLSRNAREKTLTPLHVPPPPPVSTNTPKDDLTALLRERLHRVIDSMTLPELSDLPIRAEHLTDI